MANPNKTVRDWRRKHPLVKETRPVDPFIVWWTEKIQSGKDYPLTIEDARAQYDKETR